MSDNTKEFTSDNFKEEVINSKLPVLVDFWAEWCGPCKMLTPTIDEIAKDYESKVNIGKLNVDHHPTIASEYGIRSIPSILFFKNGKVASQIVGAVEKQAIEKELETLI